MNQEDITIGNAKNIYLTSKAIVALCKQVNYSCNIAGPSSTQLHIYHVVQQCESVTVNEIADHLKISAAYASNMVENLVQQNVLKREKNLYDRRKCVITIVPEASKTIEAMDLDFFYPIYRLLEMVGVEETRKWTEVFRRIEKAIERLDQIQISKYQ